MTIDIISDSKLYNKDDFVFFNVTRAHVKYNIGGLKLRMNNLFDGIESLGMYYLFNYKKILIYRHQGIDETRNAIYDVGCET